MKNIGEGAFAFCDNLTSIDVDPGNTNYISVKGVLFNAKKTEIISYPAGKSDSFYYIPYGVTSIASSAFAGCTNLTLISIPDGVTSIGDYAFSSCTNLASISIPVGVTSIGEYAFSYCGNIDSIDIPNTVTSIDDYAFKYCIKLISVTIPNSVTSIGRGAFEYCISIESVTIPNSVTSIGEFAFLNCSWLAINGYRGSCAESYEHENNIEFIPITCTDNDMEHIVGDWLIDKYATCTVKGSKHKECTVCGEIVETTTIPAIGHTEIINKGVAATCTTSGKTDGKYCSVCNIVIIAQTTIPANGHTASVWIVDINSTCTSSGSRHKECTKCGEILETATISTIGHTAVKDAAVAATCTTAGKTEGSHCSVCNAVIKAQTIVPATGHTSSEWIIDTESTVSAPGSKHKECTECGEVLETEVIPQLKPATPKVATTNEINGVNITWNAVDGAVKYNVYRRQGGSNSWIYVGTTTGTSLTDTKVTSGIYYLYSVRAYNNAGQYSDFVSANTSTRKFMATPKLTTIYNHANGLAIKWNAVSGVTKGYRVYRRGAGSTYWTYLGTTKNLYFIDNAVKNRSGEYFRYTVIADGGYHSKFDTTGLYLKRLANPTLTSAVSSSAGITVKWGTVKGTTGYYVYRKTANSSWVRIAAVGGTNNTAYLDKTARKGVTYTYTVRAVYGTTTSAYNSGISCHDKY